MHRFFKKNRANLLALIILAIFSVIGLWSLISNPFYTSHDGFTHTARIAAYFQDLSDGQFPPRWATNFNSNFGSPIFVYSYPLPYLLGALLHMAAISYQNSFRMVMAAGFVLSGLSCFLWLRNKFKTTGALVGAVFYMWVPYHFLNVYVRAALAENLAYGFVPLVFWSIEKKWWTVTAVLLAAVLLSQNEVAALTLPLFLGWALLHRSFRRFILSTALAFALSAFIYVPDLFERQFIHFDQNMTYFRDHFVAFWQLIRSPWGYGFDFPGTIRDEMSFQLGLTQIMVAILTGGLIMIRRKFEKEVLFFFLVLAASVFLMTESPIIRNIWQILPIIKTIVDFPWRFLGITTISFAFFGAYLVANFRWQKLLAIVLLLIVFIANRNHIRINQPLNYSDKTFSGYIGTATATSDEYVPVWRVNMRMPGRPSRFDFLYGDGSISEVSENASGLNWRVDNTSGSAILRVNRFYFPQTTIKYNGFNLAKGKDWNVITTQKDLKFDDTGLMLLSGPKPGSYSLRLEETPLDRAADSLSLISFACIILLLFRSGYAAKVKN
ncbi:6-pyruvoyl-tetrahydropterin synthase-related protein [Patescibacteria group bacterium]|nr:6-pyruvoyl-tetrahydropterin synthase-related protein [Patescibacteria group bacterium]